jgi:eukaryotic-like serine/threonine-protein kinase
MQAHLSWCEACTSGLQQLDGQLASPSAPFQPAGDITRSLPGSLAPRPPAEPGPQIQHIGPYILLEQLGAGAVGSVYAAYHPQLDRQVAVKLLHSDKEDGTSDSQAPERLLREAQALARLSHPHVVAVHDAGTWEGRVFMVMERVPGMDLRAWLKERPRTWREVRDVFVQAGEGLAAAHAAGLVHRDFKPPNVLVGRDGRIRVADFGLARAASGVEKRNEGPLLTPSDGIRIDTTLTQAGFAVGTLAYMAPEQLRGLPADARTDQFAFCVSLWEALYDKRPWARTVPGTPRGQRMEPVEKRDTPPFFRALLDRGLAEEPSQRFPSMDALLDALREDPQAKRRRRLIGLSLGAVMLAVLSLGTWGVVRQRDAAARVCERPVSPFAGIWDDAAKDRLRTAFAATQVSWASHTFDRVQKTLDDYVEGWGLLDHRLCEDTLVHRTQTEETRRQQSACLERRRGEVEALVTLFGQVDAKMLDRAVNAAAELSTLQACGDLKQLAYEPPGPIHMGNAQAVNDWRKMLQQAQAKVWLGLFPEGEAAAQDVVAKARAAYEPATASEGLYVMATVKSRMGREDESLALSKQAFTAAVAGRDDVVAFRAASNIAYSLALLGKTEETREWLALSEGFLERMGASPELNAVVAQTRVILSSYGGGGDSMRLSDEAVTAAKVAFGESDPRTLKTMVFQAGAHIHRGHLEEALVLNRKLVELFESTYGKSNPLMVRVLGNLGLVLLFLGRLDEALEVQQRAYGLSLTAFGEANLVTLSFSNFLSQTLRKLGRADEAYPKLVKAIEATRSSLGTTAFFNSALAELGWLEFGRGDVKAARRAWEEALARDAARGKGSDDLKAECEDGLGQLELAAGHSAKAVAHLEKALTGREKSEWILNVDDTALTRFALAQALRSTPTDKTLERVRELLEKAEQELNGVSFRKREREQVQALRTQLGH